MPATSRKQRAMFCAAASGKSTKAKGISRASAAHFCKEPVRKKGKR